VDPCLLVFENHYRALAILGDTGAGKSTTLKLIAGMYRAQGGSVTIDGVDIRQINAMDLRRAIAYVPQELQMFHGTVAQNLRLNNMLASDADLVQAARYAGILDQILALENGFDTRIGDSTTEHLPPGFLRALSLARAFVGDDPAHFNIIPGMTIQADITTGSKTLLDYLIRPISRGFDQAFHER